MPNADASPTRVRKVALTKVVEPQYLTLTGLPANQTGFKILRKDDSGKEVPMTAKRVGQSRVRRADSVLAITFEIGIGEEDVQAILESYGLEGYSLSTCDDGSIIATRSDQPGGKVPEGATSIRLSSGRTAYVAVTSDAQRNDNAEKPAISVLSLSFRRDAFPEIADAQAWADANSVDISSAVFQTSDESITVSRSSEKADDFRQIELDTGVTAIVVRADVQEVTLVPPKYVDVVSETAFGQWGWGQLDFAAAMADYEFCEALDEAEDHFENVIERILFWSGLPLATRKELVQRATSQYAEFICTLIDALPTKMVTALRKDNQPKEKTMATQTTADAGKKRKCACGDESSAADATHCVKCGAEFPAARSDDQGTSATPAAAAAPAPATETITRNDVAEMIASGLKPLSDALAAISSKLDGGEPAQRSDNKDDSKDAGPVAEALVTVTRSVEGIGETLKGLNQRLDALEGVTAVRSDAGDGKQAEPAKRRDVFAGCLTGGRTAAQGE